MRLSELLARVDARGARGDLERPVERVVQDSRAAGPGAVFVAVRGQRVDGHDFVSGVQAEAVVVERAVEVPPGVAVIEVDDTRAALAQIAAALRGDPSDALSVVGITGTNGKTTTSLILEAVARSAGRRVGVIGTTGNRIDGDALPAGYTTPLAPEWQGLLARMASRGCEIVAAEVSSIGLEARRVDATRFPVAVFTNLSRDHLGYHGTMEAYFSAKARLFHELLAPGGIGIVNGDDPASASLIHREDVRWWRYGVGDFEIAPVAPLEIDIHGVRGTLRSPGGEIPLQLSLLGAHNAYNAMAAAGAALALGLTAEEIAAGLAAVRSVSGRLEAVPDSAGRAVLVDYAHTDDALRSVLAALRPLCEGRLIAVFGCGGDRDRGKRPLMARAATEGADLVIATSDNPRGEDPLAILDEVRPGLGPDALVIPDRAEAIRAAIRAADPGDVVLIAGKGHEQYQEILGVRRPFDDREVAARALEETTS